MNVMTFSPTPTDNAYAIQQAQLVSITNPKQRFAVEFIAHFSNNIILVSMPNAANAPYLITRGKKFQCRVAKDNVTFTYNTQVMRICQQPYVCLRVTNNEQTIEHKGLPTKAITKIR